jgi:hypothetical protein
MTDKSLDPDNSGAGMIQHGEADGQLYHYGTDVSELSIDPATGKATFQIERIFENRGSVPVTVREMGIYGVTQVSTNRVIQAYPELLARTALDSTDEITFSPGEYKKVIYEVEGIA